MKHQYEIYADETPTEVHAEDCEDTPESWPTGDANERFIQSPDGWMDDDERLCRCCPCLDDILERED